ncbi:AraC family transcriptional regulator [Pararhodonellum marinum]|uniref:AraC family transcriptional regulator n=1 Tax=Pararhodonellum marinum TaxID=2755358 RepID=UPI00188E7DB4|nr:AraC family transcriptional regulator [Pararhodonellum marinum]
MKAVLEHLPPEPEESFVVKSFEYQFFPTPWHFHPEYEIVLVQESTGKRFIGDSVADFDEGDLAFIGPNLPHLYRNDEFYYEEEKSGVKEARSIVIHFLEKSLGENFLDLPEAKNIKNLFVKSQLGLDIHGETKTECINILYEMLSLKGMPRWIKLLEILNLLSESADLTPISQSHMIGKNEAESDRMNKIFEFVMNNFKNEISINEVADFVNLSPNSFSRYFSQRTRKSFVNFVNEVRLNHATKLLQENNKSVSEICFESGFNNLSNFNRQFKNKYQINPLAYTRQFHK